MKARTLPLTKRETPATEKKMAIGRWYRLIPAYPLQDGRKLSLVCCDYWFNEVRECVVKAVPDGEQKAQFFQLKFQEHREVKIVPTDPPPRSRLRLVASNP